MSRTYRTGLIFFLLSTLFFLNLPGAAAQTATELQTKARGHLNQGRLDSAAFFLYQALEQAPDDLGLKEDQVYLEFLRRDFSRALAVAKTLAPRPDAGVKTFQLIGMTYEEIADYKEARKIYELGLSRFPNSGLLYTELGDLFATMKKKREAIGTWEKGIEMDPGYSGNYYHAAFFHAENQEPLWALLYAENFVNIESLSDRTLQVKALLTELYKKISAPGYLQANNSPFAASIVATLNRQPPVSAGNMSVEALTALRLAFIRDWYAENSSRYPYKLFEYQDQLVKEGLFDAYNQWLFGSNLNAAAYTAWMDANKEKMAAFRNFTGGRVYKVPTGQYYRPK